MNFLQLVQQLASDSGTVPADGSPNEITTVAGLTGRRAKLVRWTVEAWRAIQIAHPEWGWLYSEFSLALTTGIYKYAATDATDTYESSGIDRFREWTIDREPEHDSGITIYDSSIGLSDEGALTFRQWEWFHRTFERGEMQTGKPGYVTIDPRGALRFFPVPDTDNYVVQGDYRKSAQTLEADDDVPECDVDYHDIIVDVAMLALETFDESPGRITMELLRRSEKFRAMEHTHLPQTILPDPLA